ncbi:hypothetical protein, partial [Halomonas sp. 15WGF]|uniref:hypothetical protein n=1 Tax=Halomonas sp. 15WGF TaxID=2570357 RepID=UPI00148575D6
AATGAELYVGHGTVWVNGDNGYIAMQVSGLEVLPGAGLTDSGHTKQNHVFLKCIVGLMLMTGRSLESALETHVIKHMDQVPKTSLHAQSLYLMSDSTSWITGVIRPPDSRQLSSQWRHAMRNTQNILVLPVPSFLQPLIALLARHKGHRVRKRSIALFHDQFKQQFTNELKKILTESNKRTGSRLTFHRLGMHLFNTLNSGDADLTAACLITSRVPSFGQQASLYYFAPSNDYLLNP